MSPNEANLPFTFCFVVALAQRSFRGRVRPPQKCAHVAACYPCVWYRKDTATTFGIGIRQADAEEVAQYADNFALFNAPPGTVQARFVGSHAPGGAAVYHGDEFKPLPGYKTFVNHFHLRFTRPGRRLGLVRH